MLKVTATQLKIRLGQYMKAVRSGKALIVTDRQQPVARLVPYREAPASKRGPEVWQARDPAAPPLGELTACAIRYAGRSTTLLLTDERRRR